MTVVTVPIAAKSKFSFVCASGDTKPTVASHNAMAGQKLFEHDTSKVYIFNGSDWIEYIIEVLDTA